MTWDLLSLLGIVAFAASGAIIAMEEEYDLFGVAVLGMAAAFGGGVIRNLFIGHPITTLWSQALFLNTALITIVVIYMFPAMWIRRWQPIASFFDAIGLAAFSIQGAQYAVKMELPVGVVIFASVATGIGGGVIRDVLAGRKPLVFREEIYALWAMLSGIVIGLGWMHGNSGTAALFAVIVTMRMLSVYYGWKLPRRILVFDRESSGGTRLKPAKEEERAL
ncbi:MAG: trimeric intracellular cation channel family protein [Paenibacillus sp.]|nr:trimeric intracellular cation channel family protein [Paenibacillus sp.]